MIYAPDLDPVLPRVTVTLKAIGDATIELEAMMRRRLVALPRLQDAGREEHAFAAVTAKEKLLQRAPHWSEEQAERALRAAESDGPVDAWGDVSQVHEVSTAETMRRLAKEEQAAGTSPGETGRGPLGSASGLAPTSRARADAR